MLMRVEDIRQRVTEAKGFAQFAGAAIRRGGGDPQREGTLLRNLGVLVARREHKLEEARQIIERARAVFASNPGPHFDFDVSNCDEAILEIEFDRGRPDLALPLCRHVAEVRERLFGERHPSVAIALVNLGETLTQLGRTEEALPILRRSVELSAPLADRGGDGYERHRLAAALRAAGDLAGALDEDRRSVAASERAGESGGYLGSFPLTGLGLDLLALGRPREAVPPLERAVELRANDEVPAEVSEASFALARALFATGDAPNRTRARLMASRARDVLAKDAEKYGGTFAASRHQIEAWLSEADKK
jgi:tetratricopeptide (TPR) repeat protein